MIKYFCLILLLIGCEPVYEKTSDGREFYTSEDCIKSHQEKETGYHWGYAFLKGKFCYHWPYQCFNSCTKTICDSSKIDTTWKKIKP